MIADNLSLVAQAEEDTMHPVRVPQGQGLQAKVYAVLAHGQPMTADEVADVIGESILNVRPRVSELAKKGAVKDSGHRGRNASGHSAAKWVLA